MPDEYSLSYLESLGFQPPSIQQTAYKELAVIGDDDGYCLYANGQRWMTLNPDYRQVFELYSHFDLAEGDCVCSGLGLALREAWLLTKKDVTKITVVEKNKSIIEYHEKTNPELMGKLDVVHEDIYTYTGSCDTLLLDNFEGGLHDLNSFLIGSSQICNNIKHKTAWMWPMEVVISQHYKNYIGLSLEEIYNNVKYYYGLNTFPKLTEQELFSYCSHYHMGGFTLCDFHKLGKATNDNTL